MTDELASNPYYQNGLTLDLLCWSLISREEANRLWVDPYKEAKRISKSVQGDQWSEIEEQVLRWQKEYTESETSVSLRWPHTVFPPLPKDYHLPGSDAER